MKTSTVAAFIRGGYRHETEPVTVIANATILGTWYPTGTEPRFPISEKEARIVGTPADYDFGKTITPPPPPDPRLGDTPTQRSTFRPVPKPGSKRS